MRGTLTTVALLVAECVLGKGAQSPIPRVDGTTADAATVTRAIERARTAGKVTGLGVAVLDRGSIVYLQAFGSRDLARGLADESGVGVWGAVTRAR